MYIDNRELKERILQYGKERLSNITVKEWVFSANFYNMVVESPVVFLSYKNKPGREKPVYKLNFATQQNKVLVNIYLGYVPFPIHKHKEWGATICHLNVGILLEALENRQQSLKCSSVQLGSVMKYRQEIVEIPSDELETLKKWNKNRKDSLPKTKPTINVAATILSLTA
jgi:hypothetical protein